MKLQEYINKNYPKNERKNIKELNIARKSKLPSELDLSDFTNLEKLNCACNNLTSLKLSNCPNLTDIACQTNQLTSIDFLNQLSNPEKLKLLMLSSNNIQSTDIRVFNKFINLEVLKIGTTNQKNLESIGAVEIGLKRGYNKFFGSFKSWKDLTKLQSICIEMTDVNEGLEYLPFDLAQKTKHYAQFSKGEKGGGYSDIECSPNDNNAKCKAIQDQLRPFNYDLEAWQLANPEKMIISRPEYFVNTNSREQWIQALGEKINRTKRELELTKSSEENKEKKINRLKDKLQRLIQVNDLLEKSTQTETLTTDKSTQTELTKEVIIDLLNQLETKK